MTAQLGSSRAGDFREFAAPGGSPTQSEAKLIGENSAELERRPEVGNVKDALPLPSQKLIEIWPTNESAPGFIAGGTQDIYFERWFRDTNDPFEVCVDFDVEDHILSLPLSQSQVLYNIGGRTITDNDIFPGEVFLNGPTAARTRKVYRGSFDVFRLGFSSALLAERVGLAAGRELCGAPFLFGPHLNTDPALQRLLIACSTAATDREDLQVECIGVTIIDFLVRRYTHLATERRVAPLQPWRLRRVVDYIEATLPAKISLTDLSTQAGSSRAHFGAQFKAATGLTPHAFVMRHRLRVGKRLLMDQDLSIQEIATATGFKTPAHFAEAFHRNVGESPTSWRRLMVHNRLARAPRQWLSQNQSRLEVAAGTAAPVADNFAIAEPSPQNINTLIPPSVEDGNLRQPAADLKQARTGYADSLSDTELTNFVEEHLKPHSRRSVRPLPNWSFDAVVRHIDAHLADKIDVVALSDLVGLSKMHFTARFKQATGMTPYAFVLSRRINRAQELLLSDAASCPEIATGLGFASQAHFTTVFRKLVGDTPVRWKQATLSAVERK